ncbi:MAG TPA: TIGR03089 family protein, partial [Mycobacterium sp.]|nr:TIGR03089 family protein [Mycobacterium sp.]
MRELTTLSQALLDPIMNRDPVGPRITYYDDAKGERIELSTVTLANWAAKTANLLRDELGAGPGSRVAVLLPAHWQTAAVLLGVGEDPLGGRRVADQLAAARPDRQQHGRGLPVRGQQHRDRCA